MTNQGTKQITCTHDWREGGPRDAGRYHCRRCYQPLSVPALLDELAKLRDIAAVAEKRAPGDKEMCAVLDAWRPMEATNAAD